MELRQLKIFCTAAQTLNFTKTGLKLGYVQSNITGQIRKLEHELQVKLFERMSKGIQLTNEGEVFLKKATIILELCEKTKTEFLSKGNRGILTIGAAETACVYHLPEILTEYRKQYPQVEIRVHIGNCYEFFSLIKANNIDLAIVLAGKIESKEMAVKTLHDEEMTVVVSPSHPLAHKKKIKPLDFSNECLIITLPGCGYRPLILSMFIEHNVTPGTFIELSSIGAIRRCVTCGLGVSILPKIAVKEDLEQGKLVELDWDGPVFDVKTQLIYHREKWIAPTMRAFFELC